MEREKALEWHFFTPSISMANSRLLQSFSSSTRIGNLVRFAKENVNEAHILSEGTRKRRQESSILQ
jgi:hypothetical protein